MAKVTKEKVTSCLKGSALTLATLAGVIGGVVFGLCLRTREGLLYPYLSFKSVKFVIYACLSSHCLKIIQNVSFEFFNFGIFHQFMSGNTV